MVADRPAHKGFPTCGPRRYRRLKPAHPDLLDSHPYVVVRREKKGLSMTVAECGTPSLADQITSSLNMTDGLIPEGR